VKRIGKGYCPLLLLHLIVLRTGMLQQRPQQVGRRDIKDAEGAFEDLHVHITADTIEKVEAAVALIEPLLTPVDVSYYTMAEKQGGILDMLWNSAACGEFLKCLSRCL
jgi:hypothetical protein